MAWPLLVAVGTGAVLAYEKIGDALNEWRGYTNQPLPSTGAAPSAPSAAGAGALLLIGAGLVAAWWFRGRR